jgi:DHA2 family methylenomycin A resistance protein-like MFS transporter
MKRRHWEPIMDEPLIARPRQRESQWSARAWAIYLGWIVITLDGSALNLALPSIDHEFGANSASLAWTVDAYALPLASLLLLGGSLGDRIGAARLFRIGAIGFALSSIGCALAPSLAFLVASRALQGIFAAAVVPMILAMVGTSFADSGVLARAVNLMTVFGGAGMAIGPFLGGLLTDTVGWRAVFWLTAPFAIVAAALVAPTRGDSPMRTRLRVDIVGQLTGTVGLVLFVAGLIEVGRETSPEPVRWVLLGSGALALGAFVVVELVSPAPMMPISVFAIREFRWVVAGGFGFQVGAYGMLFFLAIFLQHAWELSALLGGLLLAPVAVGIVLSSTLVNPYLIRRGPQQMILIGSSISLVAAVGMLLITSVQEWGLLAMGCFVVGIGGGIYSTGLNQIAGRALGVSRSGLASGIYNTGRQIGQSVGVALFGALAVQAAARTGFVITMLIVAGCSLLVLGSGFASGRPTGATRASTSSAESISS